MHFIEEFRALPHSSAKSTCIRQNVCTSLRRSPDRMVAIGLRCLHTSKRMHFIEDPPFGPSRLAAVFLHTSKRMHFIEELMIFWFAPSRPPTCIRQNVCTSLRMGALAPTLSFAQPCIRQNVCTSLRRLQQRRDRRTEHPCIRQNVCTSLRSWENPHVRPRWILAYVKTYALH